MPVAASTTARQSQLASVYVDHAAAFDFAADAAAAGDPGENLETDPGAVDVVLFLQSGEHCGVHGSRAGLSRAGALGDRDTGAENALREAKYIVCRYCKFHFICYPEVDPHDEAGAGSRLAQTRRRTTLIAERRRDHLRKARPRSRNPFASGIQSHDAERDGLDPAPAVVGEQGGNARLRDYPKAPDASTARR